MKTSSHKNFLVSPAQGVIKGLDSQTLTIILIYSEDALNKVHKFLIQELKLLLVDSKISWDDPSVQSHKIIGKVDVLGKSQDLDSEFVSFREGLNFSQHANDSSKDEMHEFKEQKRVLSNKSSELTLKIDKLKVEIDKANHKLKFSQDVASLINTDTDGYEIKHVLMALGIGFIIGYVFLGYQ